jgi:hypothetical protein
MERAVVIHHKVCRTTCIARVIMPPGDIGQYRLYGLIGIQFGPQARRQFAGEGSTVQVVHGDECGDEQLRDRFEIDP